MTKEAAEARREYARKYREEHRSEINAYQRAWSKANRDKCNGYTEKYWERKAEAMRSKHK